MKKAPYILLTLLLMFQAGGLLVYYQVQQFRAHSKMQSAMTKVVLPAKTLKMPYNEYVACKVGAREIRVGGEMYDVRSIARSGDSVLLSVICDKEEQHVWSKIATVLGWHVEGGSPVPDALRDLVDFEYLVVERYSIEIMPFTQTIQLFAFRSFVTDVYASIVVPPPDCVLG